MTWTKWLIRAGFLMTFWAWAGAVHAAPEETPWAKGTYFTGDWGGLRSQLADEGVTPYSVYTSIVTGNPVGGLRQEGPTYAQDLNLGLTLDLQKLVGWRGGTFNINGINRLGSTVAPAVGGVYDPVQIYGGQTIFLYNVTLEQKFCDDLGSIKIGRLSPGDDFAESPLYNYYVSNGIDGQIRAVIFDTLFGTYPFAAWGGRLRFDPSPEFNVQTGIFQVSNHLFDPHRHGVNFAINKSDGYQLVQQFGWTPEFAKPPVATGGKGLPGHYFLGGYWSNSAYPQFGTVATARISYGLYGHADQMVYRESPGSDEGLTLFGTVAYAPQENISILPFQLSGGALYQGLIPDRPKDMTIFGIIYGDFSRDYASTVNAPLGGTPTSEVDLELGYRVQATDFAYIQPDLQYIVRPGGTGHVPDALVLGLQLGLTF